MTVILTSVFATLVICVGFYIVMERRNIRRHTEWLEKLSEVIDTAAKQHEMYLDDFDKQMEQFDREVTNELDTFKKQLDSVDSKMDEHYRWSLGIWNDVANKKLADDNPVPEDLQEVLKNDIPAPEEATVMGPVEGIEEAVKLATGIDISDKPKKKGKRRK